MKLNLTYYVIVIFSIFTFSCTKEDVETFDETQEIQELESSISEIPLKDLNIPTETAKLSNPLPGNKNTSESQTKNQVYGPEVGNQVWYGVGSTVSDFYRNGDIVQEENYFGEDTITFTVEWEDDNFVYVLDSNRDLYLALPIWYPGANKRMYWSTDLSSSWNTWEEANYYVLLGNSCDMDNEKPTIDPPCYRVSGGTICRGRTHWVPNFPSKVGDYRSFLVYTLNMDDNCDSYLTVRQNPEPGMEITGPTRIYVTHTIIDNQGNTNEVRHHVDFRNFSDLDDSTNF
ncbi:hypothetical protein [Aquimarina pacifica]|uniref:hypothetical protein n=1 Tax=Aquimarina pacifica TaxID=1296415 RepID=UPI000471437A|nr:hypothetical protein [Aquimarina pacifica]